MDDLRFYCSQCDKRIYMPGMCDDCYIKAQPKFCTECGKRLSVYVYYRDRDALDKGYPVCKSCYDKNSARVVFLEAERRRVIPGLEKKSLP